MTSDLFGRQAAADGHLVQDALDHGQALGAPEAPEGCVRRQVGFTHHAPTSQVGDLVAVVHMEDSFVHYLKKKQPAAGQLQMITTQRVVC